MNAEILTRKATLSDSKKLSILYKTVYIQTYGTEGVSDEFANFITDKFSIAPRHGRVYPHGVRCICHLL